MGGTRTLRDEINNGSSWLQSEESLMMGLKSLMFGLIEIKHNGMKHGNISPSTVFVINQQLILTDPEIAPTDQSSKDNYHSP